MTTVSIEEAQAKLLELIRQLPTGGEVVITDHDQPVARIISLLDAKAVSTRKLGTLEGSVLYMSPDFDAPLEAFSEYMS